MKDVLHRTEKSESFLTEPVSDAIGAVQEARRLKKLHAKGNIPNYNCQLDTLAEELFLTLNYLEVDIDEFTDKLLEVASEYD